MEQLLEFLKPIIEMYSGAFPPAVLAIFTIVGSLRLAIKPIMSLIQIYVDTTPSKDDDGIPAKIMENKIYKMVVSVIDWLTSIKLPKKEEK
jgi:hypothetical protein